MSRGPGERAAYRALDLVERRGPRARGTRHVAAFCVRVAPDPERAGNVAVGSTESSPPRHGAWPLPAGPWREDWGALGRADVIVVTRRRAAVAESRALAGRIAARWPEAVVASVQLALDGLAGLR